MPSSPVPLSVRAHRAAARPVVRGIAVAALAVATGLLVASLVAATAAERDRWGTTRPVAVARRALSPGDVVDGAAVEVRHLPEAVVPASALADLPLGATVRQPVVAGEALVPDRLAPQGLAGVAALVPPGHRAVAVPVGPVGAPPLAVGDLVDVVTVVPADGGTGEEAPDEGGADEPAIALADAAPVVDVGEQAVTVAVPERAARRVAWAVANGTVVLALTGA